VLKHTLRRNATELAVTLNAPIQFGLMHEELGDQILMTDRFGGSHILSLYERHPRPGKSGDEAESETAKQE
jgi:hypothetical protein